MGLMEQILEQLKNLNEKIDSLPAAAGREGTVLIDGKAAIGAPEAAKLIGIGRQNLIDQTRQGEWPYFMNGSNYMYPVGPLLKRMEEKGIENMGKIKARMKDEVSYMKLIG